MSTRNVTTRKWLPAQRSAQVVLRKRGFTVLEVLVAMFILLVGGLAILNIFPPALRVIRGSENCEIAISMTQSKLETYANEPATIPDAVYNFGVVTVANPTGWQDSSAAAAGTRIRNNSLPRENTQTAFEASALSNVNNAGFRRIVGEKHRVLDAPTAYPPTISVGRFVLTNFSVTTPTPGSPTTFPRFYVEENIIGVLVKADGSLNFENARLQSDETRVLSDATTPSQLATFWQNPDFPYYVTYRYLNGTQVNGVDDEKIVMTTATPQVFQVRGPSPVPQIVAGEVALRVRLPLFGNFPAASPERASIGFLPLPGGVGAQDALGRLINVGDLLSVDYTVNDWRNIVVDASADTPSSKVGAPATARDIKLPIPTLNSQPLYSLLFDKTSNGLSPQSGIGQWSGTPAVPQPPVVNVSSASATLSVAAGTNPQARIAYQTSRGWAQQISVAAKTYYRFDLARGAAEQERWREYWSSGSSLYFHPSEAGKTVLVTFRNGTTTITNQVTPIGRDLQPAPADPLFVGFLAAPVNRVAVATLTNASGVSITPSAILSVRGASIRARTAWIENNNYVQEIKEDYRPLTD